jgi:hypothetical protein
MIIPSVRLRYEHQGIKFQVLRCGRWSKLIKRLARIKYPLILQASSVTFRRL